MDPTPEQVERMKDLANEVGWNIILPRAPLPPYAPEDDLGADMIRAFGPDYHRRIYKHPLTGEPCGFNAAHSLPYGLIGMAANETDIARQAARDQRGMNEAVADLKAYGESKDVCSRCSSVQPGPSRSL